MNESGLEPLGHCLLVKPSELEIQQGLIQVLDSTVSEAHMLQMKVTVLEVGPNCWKDEAVPRAKAGDIVLVAKMSGHLVKGLDGKQYRVVNERDLFVRVKGAA